MKFTFETDDYRVIRRKLEAARELCVDDPELYELHLGMFEAGALVPTPVRFCGAGIPEFSDGREVPDGVCRWELEIRKLERGAPISVKQLNAGLASAVESYRSENDG